MAPTAPDRFHHSRNRFGSGISRAGLAGPRAAGLLELNLSMLTEPTFRQPIPLERSVGVDAGNLAGSFSLSASGTIDGAAAE